MLSISRQLRKDALYLSHKCRDGNLQSVFSCLDIVWTLYDRVMNWSPENALDPNRDFFIISKGQATLALYPVLIRKGFFSMEEVAENMGAFNSRYCIQTDLTKFDGGVENNAGSLGHGLPFAAGLAMGARIQGRPSCVYALCGDGEFCEGTMWEACIFAASRMLDNLCLIVDDNDSVRAMAPLPDMPGRLRTFGFDVRCVNGHDEEALARAFLELRALKNGRPKAVIARTVRGYGSPTMEGSDIWFHKAPDAGELLMLQKEVDAF